MSNTFKKISARGFTLIELLVVIAIIGLLATIIAAPIQSARKKARDAKKIAELKSTELAFEQYAESNSAQYPTTMTALSPQFMPLLPSFAASTTSNARDSFMYTYYQASSTGSQTQTFAYHLGVKLEVYGPALETDRDCTGASLTNSLSVPYCAVYNGNNMDAKFINNGSNLIGMVPDPVSGSGGASSTLVGMYAGQSTDFQALRSPYVTLLNTNSQSVFTEVSTSTCVGTTDCIFDTTSQQ